MCGIAGRIHFGERHDPPSRELLTRMIGTISHRGPDEFGLYRDTHAGLAHARLSIIDLTTGQQPLSNEDGSLWIVFNGEIFNFIEIRKDLERRGHRFRTHSDTEVIVHAYEEWEEESFPRLNGQWSLALWDSMRRRLILSRDRIGVRPLYLHEAHGMLTFASEIKALFADPRIPREIDPRGLDQTFTYWAAIAPVTPFAGIEELRPASVRSYDRHGRKAESIYWKPSFPVAGGATPRRLSLQDATELLREKLMTATRLRMVRADVPVGSYLSGGIDSSLIARMGRMAKEGEFRTFSVRFEEAEFDETAFQRMMASTLDSRHEEYVVTREEIAGIFPDVVYHAEKPLLRTAPAPMYLLSKLVRGAGFKAVLTGEGADEMLAGYDIFREAKIRAFMANQPQSDVRPKLFDRLYPYLARSPQQAKGMALAFWRQGLDRAGEPGFSHEPRWRSTGLLKRFFSPAYAETLRSHPAPDVLADLPAEFAGWDPLAKAQYLEVATLLSGYLISSQGDRMLMAHSVEGRFPFLDAEVMEFCNSIPAEYKLIGLDEKHILKRVAQGLIPDEILRRKKQPYRAPDAVSFLLPRVPEYAADLFSERALAAAGIFDPKAARGLFEKCAVQGTRNGTSMVLSNADNMGFVGILSAMILHRRFVEAMPPADREPHMNTDIDRVDILSLHHRNML